MLTKEIIAIIQSMPAGGVVTDEVREDPKMALFTYEATRAAIISDLFRKTGPELPDVFFSREFVEIEKCTYDECGKFYLYHLSSPVMNIGGYGYAFGFVGSESGDTYSVQIDRSFLKSSLPHVKAMKAIRPYVIFDRNLLDLALYNIKPVSFEVNYIALHPTKIPSFNIEQDNYPVSGEAHRMIIDYIAGNDMPFKAGRPIDKISNSMEDTAATKNK